jgi:hypothetical protein
MKICNLIVGLSLASFVGSAATAQVQGAKGAANAVPPNYRQLVAQRILESTDRRNIRRAGISRPQEQWVGLLSGGNQPAVCVEVIRETLLTSNARDVWMFTFRDGRIATAYYSNANCGNFSPFEELLRGK